MDIFLTATEARQRLLKLLAEVKEGERVIITHRGKPAAAMIVTNPRVFHPPMPLEIALMDLKAITDSPTLTSGHRSSLLATANNLF